MRSDVLAPSELEGTDYLLSSTMRLEDSFLQILGEYQIKQINIKKCFYKHVFSSHKVTKQSRCRSSKTNTMCLAKSKRDRYRIVMATRHFKDT